MLFIAARSGEPFPSSPLYSLELTLCPISLARLHSRGTTTSSGMPLPMSRPSIPATWAVGECSLPPSLLPYALY